MNASAQPTSAGMRHSGGGSLREARAGSARVVLLQERLGAFEQFFQARFFRVARLTRMDDGHLAALCGLHQLRIGSGVDVGDVRLLVPVVGEHLVVDRGALIACLLYTSDAA